jgi:hypothetical protein
LIYELRFTISDLNVEFDFRFIALKVSPTGGDLEGAKGGGWTDLMETLPALYLHSI